MKHTKIICTLGPTTKSVKVLASMIKEGMDVARLNFSHGDEKNWDEDVALLLKARKATGKQIPLLADTKGPEIRTGFIEGYENDPDASVELKKGQTITFVCDEKEHGKKKCTSKKIYLNYNGLPKDVKKGDEILMNDGNIVTKVLSSKNKQIVARLLTDGELKSRKGVNAPGVSIKLPSISEKDKKDLLYAIKKDADFVALSFVRNAENVIQARTFLEENGGRNIMIISKIENQEGVDNLDHISELSDGVMVARGDLGVEIPYSAVPSTQHQIITKSLKARKLVITATEMLDSMTRSPKPTRAEANDVYNTVKQSSTCVMLSGETANGKYPVQAVKAMSDIVKAAEEEFNYRRFFSNLRFPEENHVTPSVCYGVVATAYNLNAKAIIAHSDSGNTAKMISSFRPRIPIVVASSKEKTIRQSHLFWGVTPYKHVLVKDIDTLFKEADGIALKMGLAERGDTIVVTSGTPVGMPGSTNTMRVTNIGSVAVRGKSLNKKRSTGKVKFCRTPDEAKKLKKGDVAVLFALNKDYNVSKASAVLVESTTYDTKIVKKLKMPVLLDVRNAERRLKNGMKVEVFGDKGVVLRAEKV